jgi:hypothetical protein
MMKQIKSFQDLQNESCEIHATDNGDFYIGRGSVKKMNLSIDMLEEILTACKNHLNEKSNEAK